MFRAIKRWWKPQEFIVAYCLEFGMLKDRFDKFTYTTIEEAEARLYYLSKLSEEEILKEGFEFVPNYLRIHSMTSPNPIIRLLSRFGMQKFFKRQKDV